MAGGRPTKYTKNILKRAKQYIKDSEDEQIQLVKQSNSEKGYEMYENKLKVNLPTIEGLAIDLGISRETVYQWEKEYKEFSDIIGELKAKQAKMLIQSGLSGDYNPTIAKVLLTKHGYKEGIEQEVSGSFSISNLFDKANSDEYESS